MNLEDISKTLGQDNDAGLKRTVYYGRLSDLTTFPSAPAAPTDLSSKVTVSADFVFATGKKFYRLEAQVRKNSLGTAAAGERGSKSAVNTLNIVHSQLSSGMVGLLEEIKNDDLVVLVEDLQGNVRILGSPDLPATIENFEIVDGPDVSDEKAVKITIESVGRIAPFYTGSIPLTPAL